jgi:hypothetical protein
MTAGNVLDPRTGEVMGRYLFAILDVTFQGLTPDGEVSGPSMTERALIDTGASTSAVHPSLVRDLDLQATGRERTARKDQPNPLYQAHIAIARIDAEWTLPVVDRGDFGYGNLFRVIIGTDILQECRFVYNDPPEWFTLEVPNAGQV